MRAIPTVMVNERRATDAYAVHCALLRAERDTPALKNNPQWKLIRMDAFEAFNNAYEVLR